MLRAIIIGVIAALAICAPADAAITFNGRVITVPPTCLTGASCTTTLVGTVTATTGNNDMVVVVAESVGNVTVTVGDSKSHSYTCFTVFRTVSTTDSTAICYAFMGVTPLVPADTITATYGSGGVNESMYTAYVSGVDTNDLNVAATQQTTGVPSMGPITPNFANEFVIGVIVGAPTSFTADGANGWTATIDNNSTTSPKALWQYKIISSTAGVTFAPTNSPSSATAMTIKSWYSAGAASVGTSMTTLGVGP